MRRLALFSLALACAHAAAPPEVEVESAPIESRKFQLSEDVTAPVRQGCRLAGPRLSARDRVSGSLVVDYQVSAEGNVSGVAVQGNASENAIRAVRRYLESCKYAPAMRHGQPVAVRWKGELTFPAGAPVRR